MSRPSVIALPLAEARRVLEEAGVTVAEITLTSPPGGDLKGPLRVVRERCSAKGVHLIVAAATGISDAP